MDRQRRNYDLLGIRPGDSWPKLRSAYKSLVRKWHPDRYTECDAERTLAEEKTKEINRAYKELHDYYHRHGQLPLADNLPRPTAQPSEAYRTPRAAPGGDDETGPSSGPDAIRNRGFSEKAVVHKRRWSWVAIPLLFLGFYLWDSDKFESSPANVAPESPSTPIAGAPDTAMQGPAEAPESTRFGIGSSVGEVYSIQGIPTRIKNGTWYYGDAQVFFKNGKVSHWIDSPNNPLKVQEIMTQQTEIAKYFRKGSTKEEVRALQGAPVHETESTWDYGVSQVYFDGDKVVGWHESLVNPLRVAH